MRTSTDTPRGRTFDEVIVEAIEGPGVDADELGRRFLSRPAPEVHGVAGEEMTPFEADVIDAACDALNTVRQEIGSPRIIIPRGSVHILDRREFDSTFERPTAAGLTMYGHVYLVREADRMEFAHTATHEIAHCGSFSRLVVSCDARSSAAPVIVLRQDRSGVARWPCEGAEARYEGLNEAVTELVGHRIRCRSASRVLPGRDADLLCRAESYTERIDALRAATALLPGRPHEWLARLFRDYFSGSDGFVGGAAPLLASSAPRLLEILGD